MGTRFLQIHTLTSYPASLLNRDDAGFAKRIPFGGSTRTRISSQCLKRHWRTFTGEESLSMIESVQMSVRSRLTFDRYIKTPLEEEGVPSEIAFAVTSALMAEVFGESAKAKKAKAKKAKAEAEKPSAKTNQVTVLGHPDLRFILEQARMICQKVDDLKKIDEIVKEVFSKEAKKNLQTLRMAAGLDAALFGRMVTSDILARVDGAIHVAQAFTVHQEASEVDYFSAIDDLLKESGEVGSGHINSVELTTGLYYSYVVIDVPLLVSNIEGCPPDEWRTANRELAAEVMRRLVHLIATVSPGAKRGSTAPYAYARAMIIESGKAQPRTLANAFLKPVKQTGDLFKNTYEALCDEIEDMDQVYGKKTERTLLALGPKAALEKIAAPQSLDSIARWAASRLLEA